MSMQGKRSETYGVSAKRQLKQFISLTLLQVH